MDSWRSLLSWSQWKTALPALTAASTRCQFGPPSGSYLFPEPLAQFITWARIRRQNCLMNSIKKPANEGIEAQKDELPLYSLYSVRQPSSTARVAGSGARQIQ